MSLFFSAREVLDMAVQIERDGRRFYQEAARSAKDAAARDELSALAAMEETHEAVFEEMLRQFGLDAYAAEWYDPEGEVALYLQTFAEGQVFDLKRPVPPHLLSGGDLKPVLEWALDRERDSVLFYTGLRELIPSGPDKTRVEAVIGEEMGHIATLGRRLAEINAA